MGNFGDLFLVKFGFEIDVYEVVFWDNEVFVNKVNIFCLFVV